MKTTFFSKSHKSQLVHNRYICCSCYKTQICYTLKNRNNIYACHCDKCIHDTNIYSQFENRERPAIWCQIKKYEIHNEFNDEEVQLNWKRSSPCSHRGYCKHCNDLLLIDYGVNQYIHDINMTPTVDIFCKKRGNQITNCNLSNWISILLFHYLHIKKGLQIPLFNKLGV